jgi:hypothetical protein
MNKTLKVKYVLAAKAATLLAAVAFSSACVVAEPHEGYYDHDHNRYYREHTWHSCHEHDEYCR